MMKALRMLKKPKPGCLGIEIQSVPIPQPKNGELLVKIEAAAINPSDLMNATGGFPYTVYPRIVGRDYAGTVISGASHLVGTRVFGTSGSELSFTKDGTHAEYCIIPEKAAVRMPSNLSFTEAASVGVPFTTAYLALSRGETKGSDIVLVVGALGAVGSAVCQIAEDWGCKVITVSRSGSTDINTVVDPELKRVHELVEKVDVVIDTVGDPLLMKSALNQLGIGGRLSYISAPKQGSIEFSYDMKQIYRKNLKIIGCNSLLLSLVESNSLLKNMVAKFEAGKYKVLNKKIAETSLTDECINSYRKLMNECSTKFVITMSTN